ncbi:S9 family peptidase [Maribellus sediminis]|uniref:S9 family peptidase n=1 Tax=Maribellus sediminis TaxID=2696285 RepID=UPI0019809F8B|nr:DPP IV N-terminal domain-containing protein [Maribellus sediminis]
MKNQKSALSVIVVLMTLITSVQVSAQQWIKSMPGYEQYTEKAPQIRNSVKPGRIAADWAEDGKSFTYNEDGKQYKFDVKKKQAEEIGDAPEEESMMARYRRMYAGRPQRGRQYAEETSADKTLKAVYRGGNVYISKADGSDEYAVTTEGSIEKRFTFGTATWVYGEELDQLHAMWWSPDNSKLAFYHFDMSKVRNYYLQYEQTELYDSMNIEAYTKVGAVNPVVDLMIYDLETKKTITVDVRDGQPFDDNVVGHYVYGIEWAPDGTELLFHRTNRKQDIMEWTAANAETGKCRVVVREEWPASFTENHPYMQYLEDKQRFIWESERNGFKNYYLYDLKAGLINPITSHEFEVAGVVKIDEAKNQLYYMARSGDNHMKLQLHRVKLDGKGDVRLTDPALTHSVSVSPDGKYFIDVAETHDTPPFTQLLDAKGKVVAKLAESDMSKFEELGLKKTEIYTFTSADGETELHGMIHFPSNFDPNKKYPVILSNYGGPATNAVRENFTTPSALCEYGFLVVNIDGRNAGWKGKKMLDKLYGHLSIVEQDDFAEGIKALYDRPYVNKDRVGVFGTSYGGTTSAACILRHPDVFHASVANSGVMDWRNYDNIYTERYMNLLENNPEGYNAANLRNYAENLEGYLMIYYGTTDNNVHPSNSLQLIEALQKAGKSFEVQVGPDRGHTAVSTERMMEFFIQHLVLE